jgi:hypothetical protein
MTTSLKIPYISTSCSNCIFNLSFDDIQIGCSFSERRLQKFEQNGAKLVQKEILENEISRKYYIIEGRLCTACHDYEWAKKYPPEKWKQVVEEKIKIPLDIIIQTKTSDEIPDILKTFESASGQTIKPKNITILAQNNIVELIQSLKEKVGIPWQVENLSLKETIRYCKGIYLGIINAGQTIPNTFIEQINHLMNVEMKKFCMLTFNDVVIIQNMGLTPEEIVERAELTNTSYMIPLD